jgi:hypothetical protein
MHCKRNSLDISAFADPCDSYGVTAGATAFADSVTSAFEGVASKPMEGAEKGGATGFAKGVGKGVVGLFTKPAVGVMDFLSASTEGIRNTTTVFDQQDIDRVRLPRFIASDGVLRVSDPNTRGRNHADVLEALLRTRGLGSIMVEGSGQSNVFP